VKIPCLTPDGLLKEYTGETQIFYCDPARQPTY
jgi:hypothetical protein